MSEIKICSRCNGTGHYSYHQQYGTICFKCSGTGYLSGEQKIESINIVSDIKAEDLQTGDIIKGFFKSGKKIIERYIQIKNIGKENIVIWYMQPWSDGKLSPDLNYSATNGFKQQIITNELQNFLNDHKCIKVNVIYRTRADGWQDIYRA